LVALVDTCDGWVSESEEAVAGSEEVDQAAHLDLSRCLAQSPTPEVGMNFGSQCVPFSTDLSHLCLVSSAQPRVTQPEDEPSHVYIDVASMLFWSHPVIESMSSERALRGNQGTGLDMLCICCGLTGEAMACLAPLLTT
jgi:hypothetical protein